MLEHIARRVTFAFAGPLQSRGRLLKQIATLQKVGVDCDVVLGDTSASAPRTPEFNFPIVRIPVDIENGQMRSFVQTLQFCRRASRLIAASQADTVVCLGLGALMAGKWAKSIRPEIKLIFDNNELQIESISSSRKKLIWRMLHNHAVRSCDIIIHAEGNRMRYFKERYPGSDKPQEVIENFPFLRREHAERKRTEEVKVVYLGGFGSERFTEEIIDSFAKLPARMKLDIIGFGRAEYVARVKRRIEELGATNVRLLPEVPHARIPEVLAEYHIGLAFYRNTNLNNYYCAPNKVYDYLMNGIPIITNAYPGLLDVIAKHRVGVCVDEVDAESIGGAIAAIESGRLWENITLDLKQKYCWEAQEAKYLRLFGH
jgi:glycosyltransferase involved in cell wall biosynthesis